MKILIINGSPRKDGNTSLAVEQMCGVFREEGIETETVQIGNRDIRGCMACGGCFEMKRARPMISAGTIW